MHLWFVYQIASDERLMLHRQNQSRPNLSALNLSGQNLSPTLPIRTKAIWGQNLQAGQNLSGDKTYRNKAYRQDITYIRTQPIRSTIPIVVQNLSANET
jgi:hypothetical protein